MPRAQLTEPMVRPLSRLLPTWWRGPWLTGPASGGFSGSASAHPTDTVSAHSTFPRRSPRLVCATDPAHATSLEHSSSLVALQCQWPRLLLRLRTPPSQGRARGRCCNSSCRATDRPMGGRDTCRMRRSSSSFRRDAPQQWSRRRSHCTARRWPCPLSCSAASVVGARACHRRCRVIRPRCTDTGTSSALVHARGRGRLGRSPPPPRFRGARPCPRAARGWPPAPARLERVRHHIGGSFHRRRRRRREI